MYADLFDYNLTFQTKLIAIVLRHESVLRDLIPIVEAKYFETEILRNAWRLLVKSYVNDQQRMALDTLCVYLAQLPRMRREDVDEFMGDVKSSDLSDYELAVKEVKNFCKRAAYYQALNSWVPEINKGNYDVIVTKMMELAAKDFNQPDMGMNYFKDVSKRYLGEKGSRHDIVPTGLPLDAHWGGGLGVKEIGLVVGPTGRGKTAMMLNMAYAALRDKRNVLYVTCELSDGELSSRMDKIVMNAVRSLEMFQLGDLVQVLKAMEAELVNNHFYIKEYPAGELTVEELYSYIRSLEAQKGIKFDVIFLDYLGEMKLPAAEREDLKYKYLVTALRGLTWKMETRIWTAHQSTRGSHRSPVLLEDSVADSSGILKPVDMAFTMAASHPEFVAGFQRLCIIKNRFGPTNIMEVMKFIGKSFRFVSGDMTELRLEAKKVEGEMDSNIYGGGSNPSEVNGSVRKNGGRAIPEGREDMGQNADEMSAKWDELKKKWHGKPDGDKEPVQ